MRTNAETRAQTSARLTPALALLSAAQTMPSCHQVRAAGRRRGSARPSACPTERHTLDLRARAGPPASGWARARHGARTSEALCSGSFVAGEPGALLASEPRCELPRNGEPSSDPRLPVGQSACAKGALGLRLRGSAPFTLLRRLLCRRLRGL